MKTLFILIAIALPLLSRAQGTVYCSNLGNTLTGNFAIANDSYIAQEFMLLGRIVNGVVLTPNCTLNSVQLLMGPASGNPSGFSVSVYNAVSSGPGTRLGTLIGDQNPTTPGLYTYTTPGITLSPAANYFLVVTCGNAVAEGAYNWSTAVRPSQVHNDNLHIGYYYDSTDGANWTSHVRQDVALVAIYGTTVPEPSSSFMFVCGAVTLVCARTFGRSAAGAASL